ncbi:MAG: hypothetical protein L6Q37_14785 [Bdellovibrionaceae bacterium]|nr:hypothetical protein [Pseudobdellovibrionaceae bacterium]NUM57797.1 hypothetical protein [Pseudobdellovibrionaceae bacterium]
MKWQSVSLFVIAYSLSSSAKQECLGYYATEKDNAKVKKVGQSRQTVKKKAELVLRANVVDVSIIGKYSKVYLPMFLQAFETEFSVSMRDDYKEKITKVFLHPEQITPADVEFFESFRSEYTLKVKDQERQAELILARTRPEATKDSNKRVDLTNEELEILRIAKIIGRDFDLFEGTKYEVPEAVIKQLKKNFVSMFTFAGKKISEQEFEVFYQEKVIVDDVMGDQRYDLAQEYDPKYVTKEMIQARNKRRIKQIAEYDSDYRKQQIKDIEADPVLSENYKKLNEILDNDKDLRDALSTLRSEYWYDHGKRSLISGGKELEDFIFEKFNELRKLRLKVKNLDGEYEIDYKIINKQLRANHEYSRFLNDLKSKKFILTKKSKEANQKLISFLESDMGLQIFRMARDLKVKKREVNQENLLILVDSKLADFERLKEFSDNDIARTYQNLIAKTKMVKTALTLEEATDIHRIMSYTDNLRLGAIIKFDPTSMFGFCFGRAFFGNMIMQQNGIHKDSIKKVFVYGPMKGGLFGWGFHVAVMVDKEGGGYWVLDPSHGKVETIEDWFAHYEKASKDGRIKLDFAKGDRFGRSFWGSQDWDYLMNNYDSVLNEHLGTKYRYFHDVLNALTSKLFKEDKDKSLFRKALDGALEGLNIGF